MIHINLQRGLSLLNRSINIDEECLSCMKTDVFLFKRLIKIIKEIHKEIDCNSRTLQKEWFHTGRPQWFAAMRTHCNTLQHTATRCNTLKHTATRCNTLQQIKSCPCIHVAWCYCKEHFHKALSLPKV